MRYKNLGNTIALRLEPGDEVFTSLKTLCEREKITCATVAGLGAVNYAVVGVYSLAKREFCPRWLAGEFEIASLTGNVTTEGGEVYLHLHTTLGDASGGVYSGHLSEARVSATAEIFITRLEGTLERVSDPATGLKVLDI